MGDIKTINVPFLLDEYLMLSDLRARNKWSWRKMIIATGSFWEKHHPQEPLLEKEAEEIIEDWRSEE